MQRLCLILLLSLAVPAWAQSLAPEVFAALEQARLAQQQGDLQTARRALATVQVREGSLEAALLWRSRGYLAWAEGRHPAAIEALEKALASGQLEPAQAAQERLHLARLNHAEGRYRQVVALLGEQAARLDDEDLQRLIQAHQALKQPARALPLVERYLARRPEAEARWLEFAVAAHLQLGQASEAERWQRRLLQRSPDSLSAWQRLAALQQRAGAPDKALATLRAAHARGLSFSAPALDQLVQLSVAAGQPWQGARLLQGLLEAQLLERSSAREEQLAGLWWQARERDAALRAYRALAERSGAGLHWLRVAQLETEQQRWQAALQALGRAEQAGAEGRQVARWRRWAEQQLATAHSS